MVYITTFSYFVLLIHCCYYNFIIHSWGTICPQIPSCWYDFFLWVLRSSSEDYRSRRLSGAFMNQRGTLLTVSCVLSGAIAVISTGLGSGGFALLRIAAGIFATRDSLLVSRLPNSARRRSLMRGPVPL